MLTLHIFAHLRMKSMCSSLPHSSSLYPFINLFVPKEVRTEAAPCEALTDQTAWLRFLCSIMLLSDQSPCLLVPLQVGTLDVLVGLSDELAKLDSFVERYGGFFFPPVSSLSRKTLQCKPSLWPHTLI